MAAHTQRIILETFQEMLEEKPFHKITVSALVKRCGISPNTFYYHYEDIYDLLQTWLGIWLSRFTPQDDWRVTAKALLRDCQENKKLVEHIINYLSKDQIETALFAAETESDVFRASVMKMAAGKNVPEKKIRDLADFCRYASIGFFLRFIWDHMEADIDQAVNDLDRYLRCFVQAALQDEPAAG